MAEGHVAVFLLLFGHFYIGLMQSNTTNSESQNASCPVLCTCTSWLLSCIGAGKWHQLDNVPFIRGSSYIFNTLELGENDITTVQESNWLPYRWTETLDLHGNQLQTLQKDSFEGLILVKKLNLSGNVITKIAGFTFQALPFLENLDLSGNKVAKLLDGTFKSWHGLRFFRQLNLNANPLEVIENDAFDKLPSMQYLDLRGTKLSVQMMYPAFVAVPNIVQLDLPDGVRCCLCYVARTIEILYNTVKIECSNPCANDTSCDVSETFLMINGTVLRSQMSLKNHKILESFMNQKDNSANSPRGNSFARSSKLGLLHQIEESEKNIYIGNHLDPHIAAAKAASMPHLSRIRQRPSFDRDARFSPHLARANHLQVNINGRQRGNHGPLNIFGSDKIPLHQLTHGSRDSHNRGIPMEAGSQFNIQDKDFNLQKHKVIKRVKREPASDDSQADDDKEVKATTIIIIPPTTTEPPEIMYEFESVYPEVVELEIAMPTETTTQTTTEQDENITVYEIAGSKGKKVPKEIIVVETNVSKSSDKPKHAPLASKALNPAHFSRALQVSETIEIGDNDAANASDDSWVNPLGQFLDNAVKESPDTSFRPSPETTPATKRLSQEEFIKLFNEAYRKAKEANNTQEQNGVLEYEGTTSNPDIDTQEGNNDLFPPVHPKKIIKESVKSSSSNNSKTKTNVDDMFETKVNEEVRAVEPNKDIQTLFAHVIRIIKIDCLKPKLKAACTDLLTKIGHLMKQYEGKEYLPELGSWNPSLLRPDEKEEGDGKEPEVFPPPLSRPEQKQKSRKGQDASKGNYVPNYAEIHTEQPKKNASLSAVEYGHKLLLAIAVTVVVMIIIAVVCLIEICSQRSESKTPAGDAAKKESKSPLKKVTDRLTGKKSKKDAQQTPLLDEDMDLPKPLWLQDLYQPLDSVRKKSMGHGSHYKESSDEEEVFSRSHMSAPTESRNP
ncbi:leucine-rich repeat-containing protein 37A-like isoform X1 [Amblyraja radiata]|uniref:leucine-rich repeat-containing protein 37A-like isoform X1 n=1 Tax=Amblyraja radiata TaxID=386614 RepID=UPI001402571F|nr:leucine-rich repeat-containing protein 37A-like isoform X1 [Amblyraja radiata]